MLCVPLLVLSSVTGLIGYALLTAGGCYAGVVVWQVRQCRAGRAVGEGPLSWGLLKHLRKGCNPESGEMLLTNQYPMSVHIFVWSRGAEAHHVPLIMMLSATVKTHCSPICSVKTPDRHFLT